MSHPTASELLEAVQTFLKEAEGALNGRLAFHAKVAANVLGTVVRELDANPDAVELAAFAPLGGVDAVCEGLRDGSLRAIPARRNDDLGARRDRLAGQIAGIDAPPHEAKVKAAAGRGQALVQQGRDLTPAAPTCAKVDQGRDPRPPQIKARVTARCPFVPAAHRLPLGPTTDNDNPRQPVPSLTRDGGRKGCRGGDRRDGLSMAPRTRRIGADDLTGPNRLR